MAIDSSLNPNPSQGNKMSLYQSIKNKKEKIAVVGLGYVGLPLAIEFGKKVRVIGFDINQERISDLKRGVDRNHESSAGEIHSAKFLSFTSDPEKIQEARFIVVAVPTPVTTTKQPDLSFVKAASELVGKNLKKGSVVVFEPTVYPGVTEEVCVPILEKCSGFKYRKDFKVGYSPERINPGDKEHTVRNIVKVVSACDEETLEEVSKVYEIVVKAGVYRAASIMCAEAAKVIENTQRDLNIALMNELALIFNKMGLDTKSVLDAARTKWNFLPFSPGLVGGHCIGVDPYYLTYKAEELGYHPQVILSGRRINDGMGKYVADQTIKLLIQANKNVKNSKVVVCGITFKENVSDIRNSRVIDIIQELKTHGVRVVVCDPMASKKEVWHEYQIELQDFDADLKADAFVIAVSHDAFKKGLALGDLKKRLIFTKGKAVVVDVKGIFNPEKFKNSGILYWRL